MENKFESITTQGGLTKSHQKGGRKILTTASLLNRRIGFYFTDPFVKVTMVHFEKPIKTKKTSTKKNTIDPVINESVSFNVTPQQLENTSIVVSVWDYNTKSKDDFVGRIVLGKYGSGPHEFTHWNRMLNSQRSAVAQWHSLRSRQECDQVSPASIAVP